MGDQMQDPLFSLEVSIEDFIAGQTSPLEDCCPFHPFAPWPDFDGQTWPIPVADICIVVGKLCRVAMFLPAYLYNLDCWHEKIFNRGLEGYIPGSGGPDSTVEELDPALVNPTNTVAEAETEAAGVSVSAFEEDFPGHSLDEHDWPLPDDVFAVQMHPYLFSHLAMLSRRLGLYQKELRILELNDSKPVWSISARKRLFNVLFLASLYMESVLEYVDAARSVALDMGPDRPFQSRDCWKHMIKLRWNSPLRCRTFDRLFPGVYRLLASIGKGTEALRRVQVGCGLKIHACHEVPHYEYLVYGVYHVLAQGRYLDELPWIPAQTEGLWLLTEDSETEECGVVRKIEA